SPLIHASTKAAAQSPANTSAPDTRPAHTAMPQCVLRRRAPRHKPAASTARLSDTAIQKATVVPPGTKTPTAIQKPENETIENRINVRNLSMETAFETRPVETLMNQKLAQALILTPNDGVQPRRSRSEATRATSAATTC